MGRKMTPEERDALTTAAGEKYDLESKLDKSTITSRRGNLSDRLLQIGGMIGNAPAVQSVDRERNTLLKQIVENTADIKIEGGIEIA
jgi:hypothetical protein